MPKKKRKSGAFSRIPRLIYITWEDPSYSHHQQTEDEISGDPILLESSGFVAKSTKKTISVALQYCREDKSFRHMVHVPWKLVKQVKYGK